MNQCKIPGCENSEKAARGMYAHLCQQHLDEARAARHTATSNSASTRRARRVTRRQPAPAASSNGNGSVDLVTAAQAILDAKRALDDAIAAFKARGRELGVDLMADV